MESVVLTHRVTVYDEILDVLNTRREYLLQSPLNAEGGTVGTRLDELKIVRAIINTLKGGEDE